MGWDGRWEMGMNILHAQTLAGPFAKGNEIFAEIGSRGLEPAIGGEEAGVWEEVGVVVHVECVHADGGLLW